MGIIQALRIGFQQTNQTKRMIIFAWLMNFLLSLIVVFPLFVQLDDDIRGTVMEEQILEEVDSNWFQTFRTDNREHPLVRSFDYTIFGYAPFLSHYESFLSGTLVKNIGNFLVDVLFRWRLGLEYLGPFTILAFLYLLASTFLAGAFVGTYAKSYRLTFQEFLMEGARYFGKFFRLSLLSLLVYLVLFDLFFDWWTRSIPQLTQNEPSEWTPFVYYMVRNAGIVLVVGFLALCFDYAKIRMVVDDRFSALFAAWAGLKFVTKHFGAVAGLFVALSLIGVVLMALYAFLQNFIHVSGYWSILLMFVLQQLYVGFRLWLKAAFYASQTKLYQGLMQTDHRVEVAR